MSCIHVYLLIDCPDLLLETKHHVGEGDLRSVVSHDIPIQYMYNEEGGGLASLAPCCTQFGYLPSLAYLHACYNYPVHMRKG